MQHVLAKLKAVMKSSSNQIRGFSLSCSTYGQEISCGDDSCMTCRQCHLIRSFSALVNWEGSVDGYEREWVFCFPFG